MLDLERRYLDALHAWLLGKPAEETAHNPDDVERRRAVVVALDALQLAWLRERDDLRARLEPSSPGGLVRRGGSPGSSG